MSEEPTPRGEEPLQQDTELEQAKPEVKVEDTEPKIEVEAEAQPEVEPKGEEPKGEEPKGEEPKREEPKGEPKVEEPEEEDEEPDDGVPRVLVTGASGFIASHVTKYLLEEGRFRVRGTVRNKKNKDKVSYYYYGGTMIESLLHSLVCSAHLLCVCVFFCLFFMF